MQSNTHPNEHHTDEAHGLQRLGSRVPFRRPCGRLRARGPDWLGPRAGERSAGIRTFPLVAVAACGFVLIAIRVLGAESTGQAHILEGVITGVGFIGGGAILKQAGRASGTATAASL